MPRTLMKPESKVSLQVRLPQHVHAACAAQALEARRSLNAQLVIMLEDWIKVVTAPLEASVTVEEPTPCPTCHPAPVVVAE